ncbi:uncharacterized protein BT62DRAFT_1003179 [Guyanagaster necrorhizus]|uniref:Uncharacterized protein n=1 Tax=Guyanagaster necrorhizus TaxID=856835 RepID=A0A9P7VWX6_9AGAR|nr:uncharacterized protein BT62DRAFT_1003179 [Guyanagaster necrorhizus MCA 3950]KAG7448464.1 hypothetical protein BT62DRAFT_1003179 [Guyanagaster necrorhizus MCA 3950]
MDIEDVYTAFQLAYRYWQKPIEGLGKCITGTDYRASTIGWARKAPTFTFHHSVLQRCQSAYHLQRNPYLVLQLLPVLFFSFLPAIFSTVYSNIWQYTPFLQNSWSAEWSCSGYHSPGQPIKSVGHNTISKAILRVRFFLCGSEGGPTVELPWT